MGFGGSVCLLLLVRGTGGAGAEGLLLAVVLAGGVWAASAAERLYGQPDPGAIVIDEVAGMLITLFWIPVTWVGVLAAFLAFRFFDIVKPYPV